MNITVKQIDEKIAELMKEAGEERGPLHTFLENIDKPNLLDLVGQQVTMMTAEMAEHMAQEIGVPVLAVAPKAHEIALAHLAAFMFVAGYAMRTDEFAAADALTSEDIDNAIESILGGSNG